MISEQKSLSRINDIQKQKIVFGEKNIIFIENTSLIEFCLSESGIQYETKPQWV